MVPIKHYCLGKSDNIKNKLKGIIQKGTEGTFAMKYLNSTCQVPCTLMGANYSQNVSQFGLKIFNAIIEHHSLIIRKRNVTGIMDRF